MSEERAALCECRHNALYHESAKTNKSRPCSAIGCSCPGFIRPRQGTGSERVVHCWNEPGGGGSTCMLLENHDGPCEFTPDSEIKVRFASPPQEEGEREVLAGLPDTTVDVSHLNALLDDLRAGRITGQEFVDAALGIDPQTKGGPCKTCTGKGTITICEPTEAPTFENPGGNSAEWDEPCPDCSPTEPEAETVECPQVEEGHTWSWRPEPLTDSESPLYCVACGVEADIAIRGSTGETE